MGLPSYLYGSATPSSTPMPSPAPRTASSKRSGLPSYLYGKSATTPPVTPPAASDEDAFRAWYAPLAKQYGLDPNPDDPRHHYDYRAAYRAGVTPDDTGHWPSKFKAPDHPNRYIDGVDTITGEVDDKAGDDNAVRNAEYRRIRAERAAELAAGGALPTPAAPREAGIVDAARRMGVGLLAAVPALTDIKETVIRGLLAPKREPSVLGLPPSPVAPEIAESVVENVVKGVVDPERRALSFLEHLGPAGETLIPLTNEGLERERERWRSLGHGDQSPFEMALGESILDVTGSSLMVSPEAALGGKTWQAVRAAEKAMAAYAAEKAAREAAEEAARIAAAEAATGSAASLAERRLAPRADVTNKQLGDELWALIRGGAAKDDPSVVELQAAIQARMPEGAFSRTTDTTMRDVGDLTETPDMQWRSGALVPKGGSEAALPVASVSKRASVWRETSIERAMEFVPEGRTASDMSGSVHFADSPDLALGQGANKGVLVEMDPSGLDLQPATSKPGAPYAGELIGRNNSQAAYQRAVRSITFKPEAQSSEAMRQRLTRHVQPALERNGWTKEVLGDGAVRYTRPIAAKPPIPSDALTIKGAVDNAAATTADTVTPASLPRGTPTPVGEPHVNAETTAIPRVGSEADLSQVPAANVASANESASPVRTTAIANAVTEAERAQRSLAPVEVLARRDMGAVYDRGRQLVDSGDVDPRALATSLAEKPRALSPEETAVLVYDRMRLDNEHRALSDAADAAFASGDEAAGAARKAELLTLEDAINANDEAARRTGYEQGYGLAARQLLVREDYSAARLIQRARVNANGKPVDDTTRTALTSLSKQLEETQAKLAAAEEAASLRQAEQFTVREQRHAAHSARKAGRAATREQLDVEFADLSKQFRSSMSTPRAGLDPELVALMTKMARNRVHAGVTDVADIVDSIYVVARDHIDGLTPRQVRDAISGYGKPPAPSRDQLVGALREAKREMYLISKLEDVQAGHALPGATRFRRPKSPTIAKLERQVDEAMDAAGITRGPDKAARLKVFRQRNSNTIASLEEQLRTGNFETSRRPQALPLSREDLDMRTKARILRAQIERELELHRLAHASPRERLVENIKYVAGGIRSAKSGPDLSWPFRQGIGAMRWRKQYWRSFIDMHKFAFSEGEYQRMISRIEADPDYLFARRSGVDLTAIDNGRATNREEQLIRRELPEAIPIIGRVYKGSNRAFAGMATQLRFDLFKHMTAMAELSGIDLSTEGGAKVAKNIASVINTLTGRGSLGSLEKVAGELSTTLWSPRLISSRVHMLTNPVDSRLHPFARRMAREGLLGVAAFVGTLNALAYAAGLKVGYDPHSPDFGKIIIGKTRFDPGGGLLQFIRFGTQMAPSWMGGGKSTNSETGEVYDLSEGGYGKPTRLSAAYSFGEGKANPYMAVVLNWMRARTMRGEKVTWQNQLNALLNPLPFETAYDTATSPTDAHLLPLTQLWSTYGGGVQTYGERNKRDYASERKSSNGSDDDETFIDKVANW